MRVNRILSVFDKGGRINGESAAPEFSIFFIQPFLEFLGIFESHNPPGRQGHVFTCGRISSISGILFPDLEFAEPADQNILPVGESF